MTRLRDWFKPWRKSRTPQRVKPERPALHKPKPGALFKLPEPPWWTADGRPRPDNCLPDVAED